jgi:hypothetical protein
MFARGDICWLTYLLILGAVGSIVLQMKYLNEALMDFGSSNVRSKRLCLQAKLLSKPLC